MKHKKDKHYQLEKDRREHEKRIRREQDVRTQRHDTTSENTRTDTRTRPVSDQSSEY